MPELTLSLPVVLGLIILLLAIGAGTVFAVLQSTKPKDAAAALPTGTPTLTTTITLTPTVTLTPTLQATNTPEPPIEYKVVTNDTCGSIAYNFNVSINSIVLLNNLGQDCILSIGQTLKIPRPTPTPPPAATATLNPTEQASANCQKLDYTVKENDTLGSIAANYGVSQQSIREYNSLGNDIVFLGMILKIPLCEQGPKDTPTPTAVPPYAAPNLLLPADGAFFKNAGDIITLQWASIGELRANEAYAVTLEDVTSGNNQPVVQYVTDTKLILPDSVRPTDNDLHIFRWSILPVRQTGTNKDTGQPNWEPAGPVSVQRVFGWISSGGAPAPAATATPTP